MTRFARARGSKSSNQRLPHPPTDWSEMKQQLLETKQTMNKRKDIDDEEEKIKKMRIENYEKFLNEEVDNKNSTEWAEFEAKDDDEAPLKVSSKQPVAETVKPVQKETSDDNQDDDDDDEAPLEVSSKQPILEIVKPVQKKPKIKKTITVEPQKKNKILKIVENEKRQITRKKKRQQKQLVKKLMENGQISDENLEKTTDEIKKSPEILVKNKLKKQTIVDDKSVIKKKPKTKKSVEETEIIHGRQIVIKHLDGYRIKKDDYERIMQLKKDLKAQNQPKQVIAEAVKRVRRVAEKKLKNEYRKVCFKCREPGHQFTECPQSQVETNSSGVCFKCGSTEHTHYQCRVVKNDQFRYATCFICGGEGHISRQCPQNTNGVYPKGGSCLVCGSNEHLKKDCPQLRQQQQREQEEKSNEVVVGLLDKYKNPEIDDFDNDKKLIKTRKIKKINFNK